MVANVANTLAPLALAAAVAACSHGAPAPAQPGHARLLPTQHRQFLQHRHKPGHEDAKPSGPVGRRFKKADDYTKRWDSPRRKRWQKPGHVVALMDIAPGMTAVDIGAGTGYFLPHLSAAVGAEGRVLGLDIEPDMVRHMRERAEREKLANVEVREVSPGDPGLAPASVHRVLLVNAWHHIANRPAYAARLARALAPGGAIYIVDYTLASRRGPPRSHRLAAAQVIEDLTAAGLRAEVIKEKLPRQYIVVGRRPPG